MRIAHVSIASLPAVTTDRGGAIQRRVAELAAQQARMGHEVVVVTPGDPPGSIEGVELVAEPLGPNIPGQWAFVRRAHRRLAGLGVDVIHHHSNAEAPLLGAPKGVPLILSYDFYEFRLGRRSPFAPIVRRGLRGFDVLAPCSRYCADRSAAYWGLERDAMHILANGVNMEQFRPLDKAACRAEFGIEDAHVFGFIGRLSEQKGTDVLVEAFGRVHAERPGEVALLLAGPVGKFGSEGAGESPIVQAVERQPGARWVGPVPEAQLAAAFNAIDTFVLPTRVLEMFGMVAVEAEACGVPVIGTRHGGMRETVDPATGGLVTPGDVAELAQKMTEAVGAAVDPAGPRAFAEQYSWGRVAERSLELYASV